MNRKGMSKEILWIIILLILLALILILYYSGVIEMIKGVIS